MVEPHGYWGLWSQNENLMHLPQVAFSLGGPPVGKTQPRNLTDKPYEVGRALLGKGDLGAAAGVITMRTTCFRGIPSICDACQMSQVTRGANCPIRSFSPITWLPSDWDSHWRSSCIWVPSLSPLLSS